MFSLHSIPVRKYEFENPEDGKCLHILPPSLDTLEIFNNLYSNENSTVKELSGIVASMISNNEEGVKVTVQKLMKWMNADQLAAFVGDFLGWINGTKESNPN